MPWSRSRRIRLSTSATWRTEIAAVGSSISTILASESRVRAMATAWRWPPDICLTRSRGRVSDFSSAKISPARRYMRGVVEHAERAEAAAQFAAEEDIRGGRQIVAERQVLIDDLDAVPARLDRAVQDDARLPSICSVPLARAEIAGDHLDQRRLAGAVVAHQADDFAGLERERDVVDRLDGAEMLRDVDEF